MKIESKDIFNKLDLVDTIIIKTRLRRKKIIIRDINYIFEVYNIKDLHQQESKK